MRVEELVSVKPSSRQLAWQTLEFYGFIHFGMNTMTNREWGEGNEDTALFKPTDLDCDQWVKSMKDSGMTGAILTCKHHDGFCLWQSKHSEHTVANSPWKNGKGDLVQEFSQACKKFGLKFGIYLSPWDRTEKTYGKGKEYDDFYVHQLEELLTNYGEVFEVWLDGANGEGKNGKRQQYDWERYYEVVRRLQPQAVIAVCGPDVRWVGNEAGQARNNEWSVVPEALRDIEKISESSQKEDDGKFSRKISSSDEDLGSRKVLSDYEGKLVWYPSEVNTSIRPGWFYHEHEDSEVRTSQELFNIYCQSVGGNSTFLLNIPPTSKGLFSEVDLAVLSDLGKKIRELYQNNLVEVANIIYSSFYGLSDEEIKMEAFKLWRPSLEDKRNSIKFSWESPVCLDTIILQEDIQNSQRIEKCVISYRDFSGLHQIAEAKSIGYKRIFRFDEIKTHEIVLTFPNFREYPTVSKVLITHLGNY